MLSFSGDYVWWREEDSNLRSRTTTDLQSVPFGRSGIPPGRIDIPIMWSWRWDSNPQPADYKSAALPIELRQRVSQLTINGNCLFKEKQRRCQVFFCRRENKKRHPSRDGASSDCTRLGIMRPQGQVTTCVSFSSTHLPRSVGRAPVRWKNGLQFPEASWVRLR